ncbi:MAG: hypothetical protein IT288_10285 [Bdellovibrionales bacterium]|nr:hypothetical protein [Bdellovibrionales bacterium]
MARILSSFTTLSVKAPAPPPTTNGSLYVAAYNGNQGSAHPASYQGMFWQSDFVTKDGTLIEWGTGDHGHESDNGVREYDPVTKTQTYVYPNNRGTVDQSQYDNLHYFYIDKLDSLVIPARGQYHRASGKWLIGNLSTPAIGVVGNHASSLMAPLDGMYVESYTSTYNAHQAFSQIHDCGICIAGGNGGDTSARQYLWIIAPSHRFGTYQQPYVIYRRDLPATVGGELPHKINGRDGCCFAGEYVYWVGGGTSIAVAPTPHFFRLKITPHLASTSAPLVIERLADAPASFVFGLLRYDPTLDAMLCVTNQGIFAYDVPKNTWDVVTPPEYLADYAGTVTKGLLPAGCLGDWIGARSGQTFNQFYWRPGLNHGWDYDYGGTNSERMYRRFRSIKLGRRA